MSWELWQRVKGVVRQGPTVQMAFELKREWEEGTLLGKIWGKFGSDRGNIKCKNPGSGMGDKARMPEANYKWTSSLRWEKLGEVRWIAKELQDHIHRHTPKFHWKKNLLNQNPKYAIGWIIINFQTNEWSDGVHYQRGGTSSLSACFRVQYNVGLCACINSMFWGRVLPIYQTGVSGLYFQTWF